MKRFQFQKIKEFREAAGLTQLELAQKCGVMVQQISAWENSGGDTGLGTTSLAKIANVLGKRMDDFFVEDKP